MAESDLGITSRGGLLRRLPANASREEQIAQVNQTIQALNTWNGVIVQTGTVEFTIDDSEESHKEIEHGLGYVPVPQAFMNGISTTNGSGTFTGVTRTLPTWLGIEGITADGRVYFTAYLDIYVDDTKVYLHAVNETGSSFGTFTITYYLMRIDADKA